MIWVAVTLILLVAVAILAWPLIRPYERTRGRADQGLEVYRQQLSELATDVGRGSVGKAESEAMEIEIKRRMLRLSKTTESHGSAPASRMRWQVAALLCVAIPVISLVLYVDLGSPDTPAKPLAARDIAAEQAASQAQDIAPLIQRLIDALREQPDNLEGWVLLARTLGRMERYDEAAETYMKATLLAPKAVELYIGAGENYYFAADGNVTEDAANAFEKAFEVDPENPGARYYLALRDAQAGDPSTALRKWIALYEESPDNAPFMPVLARRIEQTAETTGTSLGDLFTRKPVSKNQPGPNSEDIAAAAGMSPEDRQEMISSMVDRLAARMNETPDYDGLMRLGQVYGTLQNYEESANSYGRARSLKPDDLAALQAEALAHVQASGEGGVPPASAVELYRDVLVKSPNHPQALWYLGVAEAAAGNNAAAVELWTRLQNVTKAGSPVHTAAAEAIKSLSATDKN